jgi:hypothetical protein
MNTLDIANVLVQFCTLVLKQSCAIPLLSSRTPDKIISRTRKPSFTTAGCFLIGASAASIVGTGGE